MARAAVFACVLLGACPANPYVIGQLADAAQGDLGASPDGSSEAASDAGSDADECTASHRGALLCSGFESLDWQSAWDVAESSQGSLARSTVRAHAGAAALHATSTAPNRYALIGGDFVPLRAGELYVRAFLYVPSGLTTETMNILFVGDGEPVSPFEGVDINLVDGALQVFSPQSPRRHTAEQTIPRDRWFCFRLRLAIGDERGSVQLFVDDRSVVQSEPFDTLPAGGVRQLRAGVDWSSEQSERFEIYIDDLVVDEAEVLCE